MWAHDTVYIEAGVYFIILTHSLCQHTSFLRGEFVHFCARASPGCNVNVEQVTGALKFAFTSVCRDLKVCRMACSDAGDNAPINASHLIITRENSYC